MIRDPLQFPEAAGPDLVSPATRIWLGWVGLSVVVAVVVAYGGALIGFHGTDLAIVAFGWGCAWSALTPVVIRRIGRWMRG
jgi:hypothetical protein